MSPLYALATDEYCFATAGVDSAVFVYDVRSEKGLRGRWSCPSKYEIVGVQIEETNQRLYTAGLDNEVSHSMPDSGPRSTESLSLFQVLAGTWSEAGTSAPKGTHKPKAPKSGEGSESKKAGWKSDGSNDTKLAKKFDLGFRSESRPVGMSIVPQVDSDACPTFRGDASLPSGKHDIAYVLTETATLYCVQPAQWMDSA